MLHITQIRDSFKAVLTKDELETVIHCLSTPEVDYILNVATETVVDDNVIIEFEDNGLYDPNDIEMESIAYALEQAGAKFI